MDFMRLSYNMGFKGIFLLKSVFSLKNSTSENVTIFTQVEIPIPTDRKLPDPFTGRDSHSYIPIFVKCIQLATLAFSL
ncbi:hypothetical protein KUTeg_024023 [Tegillarca granosa]|uniref:Uncharacterized protein n=1 Tax=Tegillarca granosa TaxID=220873 RepID=A0ABQ9E1Q9_TEGGR|nr:hypothetical protein KUTeg_024023 [Tegillarca granosa]